MVHFWVRFETREFYEGEVCLYQGAAGSQLLGIALGSCLLWVIDEGKL